MLGEQLHMAGMIRIFKQVGGLIKMQFHREIQQRSFIFMQWIGHQIV